MQSLSLKFRITALALLVAVVPLFIFNIISAKSTRDNMIQTVSNGIQAESILLGDMVSRFLSQRLNNAMLLRQTVAIWDKNPEKLTQLKDYLHSISAEQETINDIKLVDSSGKVLISSTQAGSEGLYLWDVTVGIKDLFNKTRDAANDSIYTSEARQSKLGAEFNLLTAVLDDHGKAGHVLVIESNIDDIRKTVVEFNKGRRLSRDTYVVDKLGTIIVTNHDTNASFAPLPDTRIQPAMLSEGKHGIAFYKNSQNVRVVAGYRDIEEMGTNKGLNWSIITVTPIEQIVKPAQETSQVLNSIGILVSGIAVLVAYVFAGKISVPLQRTVALAEEIRRGNYSQRLESNLGGEIGSLATAINEMADKVEQRTAEIVTRNEKLTSEIVERKIAQDRLQKISHKIVRLQEEERRRVSRELHDGINQLLVSVKYKIENFGEKFSVDSEQALKDIKTAQIFLDEAIAEVRRVSHDLRPSVLDDLGLAPALANLIRRFSERSLLDVELKGAQDGNFLRLPSDVETAMYRIVQEALTNIDKHANATKVLVNLSHTDANVTIRIEDNGEGFSLQKAMRKSRNSQGMGLRNMRERIELLQGSFFIHSDIGRGTFIEVRAPLKIHTPLNLET
ncbi:MAG: histidine kinase [Gammaproteobacteria bacterium]|nr:histidine kinase [Gammaproteobacteria bacterium]MDH5800487.1 histidine kinase [Gammaproteobacteria bacterium]